MSFRKLAAQYEAQTALHSLPGPMRAAPAFQGLVEMGPLIVPLIISGLKQKTLSGVAWFLVLEEITQTRPLPPEPIEVDGEKIPGMVGIDVLATTQAWINWGETNGYLDDSEPDHDPMGG